MVPWETYLIRALIGRLFNWMANLKPNEWSAKAP